MSGESFVSALKQWYDEQKECDVKFLCPITNEPSDKETIGAHKVILSMSSDVFYSMFYGWLTQISNTSTKNVIEIPDIKISIFKMLLSFIYGKPIELDSIKTAIQFYYAADKYNCKDALKLASNYMLKKLNAKNCIFIYEATYSYNNDELKHGCLKIFSEASDEILTNDEFLSADINTLETIFGLETLAIESEMDLVKALERYIEHNKANDPIIVVKLRPVLSLIRFLTLKLTEIVQTTLLTSDEIVNVIACLTSHDDLSKMPKGLSTCTELRHFKAFCQMIRELSDVFSSKYCNRCIRKKETADHALWDCLHCTIASRTKFSNIFEKYNHASLVEYDRSDVKALYDLYKKYGYIE